jgi:hypothetical protein
MRRLAVLAKGFRGQTDDGLAERLDELKSELVDFEAAHRRTREEAHDGAARWLALVSRKRRVNASAFSASFTSGGPPVTQEMLVEFALAYLLDHPDFVAWVHEQIDASEAYSPLTPSERKAGGEQLRASIREVELELDRRRTEREAQEALTALEERAAKRA